MSTPYYQEDSQSDSEQPSYHYRPDPELGANKYLMADYQLSCTIKYFNQEPNYRQNSDQNSEEQEQDSHISYQHSSDLEPPEQDRECEDESSRSSYYHQESNRSSNSQWSNHYNSSQHRRPRQNQRRNYQFQYDNVARMDLYGPPDLGGDSQEQRSRNRQRRQNRRYVISEEKQSNKCISQEKINQIPTLDWKKQYEIFNKDEKCSICLCTYEIGQTLRVLRCIHRFHRDCIDKWLKTNASCPGCRKVIETDQQNGQI